MVIFSTPPMHFFILLVVKSIQAKTQSVTWRQPRKAYLTERCHLGPPAKRGAGKGNSRADDALCDDNADDIYIDVDDEGDQNAGGAKGSAGEEPSPASCVCRIWGRCRQSCKREPINLSTSKFYYVQPDRSVLSIFLLSLKSKYLKIDTNSPLLSHDQLGFRTGALSNNLSIFSDSLNWSINWSIWYIQQVEKREF